MKHDLMTKLSLPEKKPFTSLFLFFSFFESAGFTFEVLKRAVLHLNNLACCARKLSESVCQNQGVALAELQNAPYPDYIFSYLEIFCLLFDLDYNPGDLCL